jgi:hypothetical protein
MIRGAIDPTTDQANRLPRVPDPKLPFPTLEFGIFLLPRYQSRHHFLFTFDNPPD